ncbi:LLM class F420-dependent oxidoreductase [Nocardia araoensis]|uniref:LLM class F420-dependent oxidoreductase n=1 Tax=Nocardia araoensis TaxID=228600 RepID=UPI000585ADD1|nr:LLM class F420-dependent oxidoreductase [Nocardia araoensis]
MDAGVAYFPTHDGLGPAELARTVEERGHRWLMWAEHTHIPAARETPWRGEEGAPPLPRKYAHIYDPFVASAYALGATKALRVGTGIALVAQRDPIITAKEVASLDHLSGGRFDFGIGAGWNREEMANHGTDPRTRMKRMGEYVRAMKAIWTQHEASFEGEFVSFDRIWSDPKPIQRPHPPILVGGGGPTVLDRVLEYGDAWMPNHGPGIIERITELRERADRPIDVVVMGAPVDDLGALEAYAEAGVDRVLFWLPSARRSVVERELDQVEAAMAELHDRPV